MGVGLKGLGVYLQALMMRGSGELSGWRIGGHSEKHFLLPFFIIVIMIIIGSLVASKILRPLPFLGMLVHDWVMSSVGNPFVAFTKCLHLWYTFIHERT